MPHQIQTTREGFEYRATGRRVIIPTPDHEDGGGIALTAGAFATILVTPERGEHETTQTDWHTTGDTVDTRVGPSKVVEISQTAFGTVRTTTASLVDLADAELDSGILD